MAEQESFQRRSTKSGKNFVKNIKAEMKALNKAEEKEDWNAVDEIRESLGDCLDLKVSKKLDILISTGGPASKITYDVDTQEAEYWFQDWFKPWTSAKLRHLEQNALNDAFEHIAGHLVDEIENED